MPKPPKAPRLAAMKRFNSAKVLVLRARENIDDFHERGKAIFHNKTYMALVELDPNTGENVHKIKLTEKLPLKRVPSVRTSLFDSRDRRIM